MSTDSKLRSRPSNIQSRASAEFSEASKKLLEALPNSFRQSLSEVKAPEFDVHEAVEVMAEKLGSFLETLIQSRESYKHDPRRSAKAKRIVQSWFTASYPFAERILNVGKEAISLVRTL
jgi:uncharacterized protein (UPF0305 family)